MNRDIVKCLAHDYGFDFEELPTFIRISKSDTRKYIVDVYFKWNKQKTRIIKNTSLIWSKNKWTELDEKGLEELLKTK